MFFIIQNNTTENQPDEQAEFAKKFVRKNVKIVFHQ
jgi:hypothetical protein